ncbi:rho GTPase-activating protein gacZ-like isoform X3 [Gossypium australe]|uniref:Rho GTPase-activating protein gacZ-like isoform X3 n=1 Tax=Gossypium australe TaxID=47621 RepID=A0A5B6UHV6_9ROSI|nr:rho GTPase-activating protein gacZ-like isoform X3 [Gossypium australe]
MIIADALIDIPAIRRIDKLRNVPPRRKSTGKVIMPGGGLTVLSRYLHASQGSCHDFCKYGTGLCPGPESKISGSPLRKVIAQERAAIRNLERVSESNAEERRKKSAISVKVYLDSKIQEADDPFSYDAELQKPKYPSHEDPVNIEAVAAEGEAEEEEENAETKSLRGEKNRQVCVKPSTDSESQKPDCLESEVSSWTDKESVLWEQELLSLNETDYVVAHVKDSKLKPQSKPSSLVKRACPSGKQNSDGLKRKEGNILSMTSLGVSSGRNKGDTTIRKGIRTSVIADKKNVVLPSVSFSPKESDPRNLSMNAQKKWRGVYRPKKQENAKQIKPDKLHGKNAKVSENLKGVSHSMDQENVNKLNSEQANPETTSYLIKSNPENKPAESDQNNVVLIRPPSSSKDKSMKHNQNRISIGRPPHVYEKKKLIYKPKGIQSSGLPLSLCSFPGKRSLRPTPNGLTLTQPSLASLSTSVSSKSSHNDTLTEHDKAVAENKKSSSKMIYKARPKRALMITSNNKNLPGKKLNFQRGKMIELPVEDCTPRRLTFKKRELVDNRNDDNWKGKVEDCTPRRLKFKQRVYVNNINDDNKNSRVKEFTPKRLKFRGREIVDNRNGDNQNGKVKECTPKRLKFRQRVIVDNQNGDNKNSRIEELTPRIHEFRRKLIVDNIDDHNQNAKVEEFSPRKLESRQRNLDNRNSDDQNSRGEDSAPTKLKSCQRTLDNRNSDDQNSRVEDSAPRKLIFRPKVPEEQKIDYIQTSKAGTSKNDSGRKEAYRQYNGTKIQSRKFSLIQRDIKEKKVAGILYNNIIEETASKFARTKASKVKALVSAFETVISLDTGISESEDEN